MIDPMDGTREFIEDRDEFAVQIGLVVDRTPVLGVVYQPTAGKLYYAARGLGAFLDSGGSVSKLHVSAEQVASRLTIVESRSHRSARVAAIRQQLRIAESVVTGSVGLKVAMVCEGRAHLYVHPGPRTHLWARSHPARGGRPDDGHFQRAVALRHRRDLQPERHCRHQWRHPRPRGPSNAIGPRRLLNDL